MRKIIDHTQLFAARQRAERMNASGADFLLRHVCDDLLDRLSAVSRTFDRALIIGPRAEFIADVLKEAGKVRETDMRWHRCPPADEVLSCDPASYDAVISVLSLHETNDTPGVLAQIQQALKPDGLFLACLPGGNTLQELRDCLLQAELDVAGGASPRVMPWMDVRDAGALLQRAKFAMPVADIEPLTVRYQALDGLMRDLRQMGSTNCLMDRRKHFTPAAVFAQAAALYAARFSDQDGRLRATFEWIWMSGWRPDASQPQPLKPGSAQISLAKILS